MKQCPNCKIVYDDNHDFCYSCGSRLVDSPQDTNPVQNSGSPNVIFAKADQIIAERNRVESVVARLFNCYNSFLEASNFTDAFEAYSKVQKMVMDEPRNVISKMNSVILDKINNKDYDSAVPFLKLAVDNGYVWAKLNLADIYIDGKNVGADNKHIDYNKGFSLLMEIAQSGNTQAMANVGWCYQTGRGMNADFQKALVWYQKALDNGYSNMNWITSNINRSVHGLCQIAKEQIKQCDFSAAIQILEPFAKLGKDIIYTTLADAYSSNPSQNNCLNYEKAFYYVNKSVELGNIDSLINEGKHYHYGLGVKEDVTKALECYTMAVEKGTEMTDWLNGEINSCKSDVEIRNIRVTNGIDGIDVHFDLRIRYQDIGSNIWCDVYSAGDNRHIYKNIFSGITHDPTRNYQAFDDVVGHLPSKGFLKGNHRYFLKLSIGRIIYQGKKVSSWQPRKTFTSGYFNAFLEKKIFGKNDFYLC